MNLGRDALRLWPWLGAVTTGLLCAASFPPFDQWWLCWIALAPLLASIWFGEGRARRSKWRGLLLGYTAGLAYFWTVFSWLTTVTVLGWFLLQFYMAVYLALWGWLAGALRPQQQSQHAMRDGEWLRSWRNLLLASLLACGWVAQEYLRSRVFSGWGWDGLGAAMHRQLALIQVAEFTGVAGLSFVAAFVNAIVVVTMRRIVAEMRSGVLRPHFDFTLTMAGVIGLMAYGLYAMHRERESKTVRVALVQANVPREEKFDAAYAPKIFERFRRLSEPALRAAARPELIVWPESSTPAPVLEDEATYDFVTHFAADARADLLLGTIDVQEKQAYNAALLVGEEGRRLQLYRKLHLVPFGEYLPGRRTVPFLAQIVTQVPEDFTSGKEYTVFHLSKDNIAVAPLICFEDTIGELTRQFVLNGAALLANVTNDGWFLKSAGSQQHLANAVFRTVETRRPLIRAANTGVTCIINEWGRITQVLLDDTGSQFTEGVLIGEVAVPMGNQQTFYVRHGEVFAYVCAAVSALTLASLVIRRWRGSR